MEVFDATPPEDYPEQVIVAQDAEFAKRHPEAAYWLRVKKPENGVDVHQLPGAVCAADARRIAKSLGFDPTHWTMPGSGPYLF